MMGPDGFSTSVDGTQTGMLEFSRESSLILPPYGALPARFFMDISVKQLLGGDQRALSRLISLLENGDPRGAEILAQVYPHIETSYCIGVTGPPGVGKSTLVDSLVGVMRGQVSSIGIIALDPSSPYSGGAFLGDRIRMQRHYSDPEVFIRSMATRASAGGLPRTVQGIVRLLAASGKKVITVETVGVGQTELGVMAVADTSIVALSPETGDAIQTLKAGLMEVADIFVVNKADRQGADKVVTAIKAMLEMSTDEGWTPPVLTTEATKGIGIDELYQAINRHREYLDNSSQLETRRSERRGLEFLQTIDEELVRRSRSNLEKNPKFAEVLKGVKSGELEPYSSALALLGKNSPSEKDG